MESTRRELKSPPWRFKEPEWPAFLIVEADSDSKNYGLTGICAEFSDNVRRCFVSGAYTAIGLLLCRDPIDGGAFEQHDIWQVTATTSLLTVDSTTRDTAKIVLERWLRHYSTFQLEPVGKTKQAYPNPPTYARDKWIFQNIRRNNCDTLSHKLREIAKKEKWNIISSRNGFKKAADRYAEFHSLEKRRFATK